MNVASLELCRELYELSGWDRQDSGRQIEKVWMRSYSTSEMGQGHPDYSTTPESERNQVNVYDWCITDNPRGRLTTGQEVFKWWYSKVRELEDESFPAYDLGYLLRKLPHSNHGHNLELVPRYDATWYVGFSVGLTDLTVNNEPEYLMWAEADTPEDAAAKLAIELFKQNVLVKS